MSSSDLTTPQIPKWVAFAFITETIFPLGKGLSCLLLTSVLFAKSILVIKNLYFVFSYRFPSQDADEFADFKNKWEETIININNVSPAGTILLGDFNARNSDWWTGDATNSHGEDISDIALQHSFHQLIDEPTHFRPDCSPSCIDLIFTSSEALVCDSGVLPSLHSRCHHQITFVKINFQMKFPPSYERKIWDFSRANEREIVLALNAIDWDTSLQGLNVDDCVALLSEYILNIFFKFCTQ